MAVEVNSDGVIVDVDYTLTLTALNGLLAPLPGYSILSEPMKLDALAASRIPDASGVWPGSPGYVATYDVYWAATLLVGFLRAQPIVRQSSSEGTSVSVDAPDWAGLLLYYRSQSPVAQASGATLTAVPIPDGPHVQRTDMSGRWDGYGDIDTDLA